MPDSLSPEGSNYKTHRLKQRLAFGGAGVTATILIGIATQKWGTDVPNWLLLVLCLIPFYLFLYWLWTLETVTKHRRRLVYTYPRMMLIIMIIVGALLGGVFGALLWRTVRAENLAAQAAKDAIHIDKGDPEPKADIDMPDLRMSLGQCVSVYDNIERGTFLLINVELRNNGAPSATNKWGAHYKSSTLDAPIGLWRVVKQPMRIPLTDQPRGVIEYYNSDSIVEKTAQSAVVRGVPVHGRLPLWVPGDRVDEIKSGGVLIEVVAHDWRGQPFYGSFLPSGPEEAVTVLPGETVAPKPGNKAGRKKSSKKRRR